ncbi:unnamed protein product [Brachionus calyciflorus]|uniref:HORMA domain-containing protein n=1 Tax=Brachionus calyciflorus TaxID=104777 RepID=A0A813VKZ7_9BILA|nr:unnamed protein product [Brachionus calyciflorus]
MDESTLTVTSNSKKEYLNPNIRSYEDSVSYTKKLMMVGISNIVYLRSLFPEEVFSTKDFENLKIKIIKSKDKDSRILIEWLKGAFDALDKKYLKTLSLAIYPDSKNPEDVLETYDFHLSYSQNVNLEFTNSKNLTEKVKLNSLRLIRTIIFSTQSLDSLPQKLYINMRLFYYDDITPEDYQPPGFRSCDFENYKYKDGKIKIPIGSVHCLWHQLKLDINCSRSMLKHKEDFAENLDSSVKVQKTLNQTVEMIPLNISMVTDDVKKEKLTQSQNPEETIASKISDLHVDSPRPNIQTPSYSPIESIKKISCICEIYKENNMRLIKCSICNTFQHAICYNVFIGDDDYIAQWEKDYKHCCIECYKQSSDKTVQPIDSSLVNLDKKRLTGICVWRRALYFIHTNKIDIISSKDLMNNLEIKQSILTSLIQRLEKDNLLECISKKEGKYKKNRTFLDNLIQSSFIDPTRKLKEEALDKQKKLERRSSIDIEDDSSDNSDEQTKENFKRKTRLSMQCEVQKIVVEPTKKLKTSVSNNNISQS